MGGVERIGLLRMANHHMVNRKSANLIQSKDTDGDGVLNIGELGVSEDIFAKIDKNEDGQVSRGELNAFFPKAHLNRVATNMLENKDTNADGLLNPNEFGVPYERFMMIDKNGDGQIGRGELRAFLPKAHLNHKTAMLIQNMDTNGDGVLNSDELPVSDERFAMIDKNEDGQIDRRELKAFLPKAYLNHKTAMMIQNMDANGDGLLNSDELPVSDERFAMLDKNGDGQIGRRELSAALRPMHFMA